MKEEDNKNTGFWVPGSATSLNLHALCADFRKDCERFAFIIENRVLPESQFSTQCVENLMNWPTACWLIVLSMKRQRVRSCKTTT